MKTRHNIQGLRPQEIRMKTRHNIQGLRPQEIYSAPETRFARS